MTLALKECPSPLPLRQQKDWRGRLSPAQVTVEENSCLVYELQGFPGGSVVKNLLQCRRCRFDPWVWKMPWRMKQQSTPVFLSGKSHGHWNLAGYSPRGHKESDMAEKLSTHTWLSLEHSIGFPTLNFFLSLSLSLSHTHTHTLTHTPSYMPVCIHEGRTTVAILSPLWTPVHPKPQLLYWLVTHEASIYWKTVLGQKQATFRLLCRSSG